MENTLRSFLKAIFEKASTTYDLSKENLKEWFSALCKSETNITTVIQLVVKNIRLQYQENLNVSDQLNF
jgi:hypothetical protein